MRAPAKLFLPACDPSPPPLLTNPPGGDGAPERRCGWDQQCQSLLTELHGKEQGPGGFRNQYQTQAQRKARVGLACLWYPQPQNPPGEEAARSIKIGTLLVLLYGTSSPGPNVMNQCTMCGGGTMPLLSPAFGSFFGSIFLFFRASKSFQINFLSTISIQSVWQGKSRGGGQSFVKIGVKNKF